MAAPVVVGEPVVILVVAPEIHIAVPVTVDGVLPPGPDILKSEKAAPGVVEDAVDDDLDADVVAVPDVGLEILVRPDASVDPAVIDRIIAVAAGFKERSDIDCVHADALRVLRPLRDLRKMRALLPVVLVRTAAEPERINMIENSVVIPCHKISPLNYKYSFIKQRPTVFPAGRSSYFFFSFRSELRSVPKSLPAYGRRTERSSSPSI